MTLTSGSNMRTSPLRTQNFHGYLISANELRSRIMPTAFEGGSGVHIIDEPSALSEAPPFRTRNWHPTRAGRDVRRALEIFLDFCNSGHIGEDEIYKIRGDVPVAVEN